MSIFQELSVTHVSFSGLKKLSPVNLKSNFFNPLVNNILLRTRVSTFQYRLSSSQFSGDENFHFPVREFDPYE